MIKKDITTKTDNNLLLSKLNKGQEAILMFIKDSELANRLLSMGMLPGISCKVIQKSFSHGFYIQCEGRFNMALRRSEAESIVVSHKPVV